MHFFFPAFKVKGQNESPQTSRANPIPQPLDNCRFFFEQLPSGGGASRITRFHPTKGELKAPESLTCPKLLHCFGKNLIQTLQLMLFRHVIASRDARAIVPYHSARHIPCTLAMFGTKNLEFTNNRLKLPTKAHSQNACWRSPFSGNVPEEGIAGRLPRSWGPMVAMAVMFTSP